MTRPYNKAYNYYTTYEYVPIGFGEFAIGILPICGCRLARPAEALFATHVSFVVPLTICALMLETPPPSHREVSWGR